MGRTHAFVVALIAFLACASAATSAFGQFKGHWLEGDGVPGLSYQGYAMLEWDRDGAGPEKPVVVVGGSFRIVGKTFANNIATWDGTNWSTLGDGFNGVVQALAVLDNGELVAAGAFTSADGAPANRIARWTGAHWEPLGTGIEGVGNTGVLALHVLDNGDLIVGGYFTSAGGVAADRIARWDGRNWSAIGPGFTGNVYALASMPNGDLIAAGNMTASGSTALGRIAKWDGSQWQPLGSGFGWIVRALAVSAAGDLFAAGSFSTAGGQAANHIARWDGRDWQPLGSGIEGSGYAITLEALANGDVLVGGSFIRAGGVVANCLARWDGKAWSDVGTASQIGFNSWLFDILPQPNGDLLVCGDFTMTVGRIGANSIARWDGSEWSSLASGVRGVGDIFRNSDGAYIVSGSLRIGNSTISGFGSLNQGIWTAIDGGCVWTGKDCVELPQQRLAVAGEFGSPCGNQLHGVAIWNGREWTETGLADTSFVDLLTVLPNGDLVASGPRIDVQGAWLSIARFDGSTWSPMGAGLAGQAHALALLEGELIAGGAFFESGAVPLSNIARWDGMQWLPFTTGVNNIIHALLVLPNGDLLAGGGFTVAGDTTAMHIARWDGRQWHPLGEGLQNGYVHSLALLRNGDIIAGGDFTVAGDVPVNHIARWDGEHWHAMGEGVTGGANADVLTLVTEPNGDLLLGGAFLTAGGKVSSALARYRSTDCASDIDGDGEVTRLDLLEIIAHWGLCPECGGCAADVAPIVDGEVVGDCQVNVNDLITAIVHWGSCP